MGLALTLMNSAIAFVVVLRRVLLAWTLVVLDFGHLRQH